MINKHEIEILLTGFIKEKHLPECDYDSIKVTNLTEKDGATYEVICDYSDKHGFSVSDTFTVMLIELLAFVYCEH